MYTCTCKTQTFCFETLYIFIIQQFNIKYCLMRKIYDISPSLYFQLPLHLPPLPEPRGLTSLDKQSNIFSNQQLNIEVIVFLPIAYIRILLTRVIMVYVFIDN